MAVESNEFVCKCRTFLLINSVFFDEEKRKGKAKKGQGERWRVNVKGEGGQGGREETKN